MKLPAGLIFILMFFAGCKSTQQVDCTDWEKHGELEVQNGELFIQHEDGSPFLWIGCTAWGLTEWLSREEIDLYLDDRKSKGMNVVQFCLFWGKRVDYPTKFTANAPNFYGHKAFTEQSSIPDPTKPAVVEGGSPENPNDYWDHVDYCLQAIKERGMYAAALPFWGRRYVNASHTAHSKPVFTTDNIFQYGKFLGERYGDEPNIIWVNGGDVKANAGGDYLKHYRLFAGGLLSGVTGKDLKRDEQNSAWNEVLMTYHPDGAPLKNSSTWFHDDPWLDFNMIETHVSRDYIVDAILQDLNMPNPKPTVLAEPHYEGITNKRKAEAIHMRRQAYQSFFAGACGFTYGGGFDEKGNGPLFSPSNNWKHLLDQEGASQMLYVRRFLENNKWWNWQPANDIVLKGKGDGELEKLAVKNGEEIYVYFPDNSSCIIALNNAKKVKWFNTKSGKTVEAKLGGKNSFAPPDDWEDGILMLNEKN